jgi:CRISPR-associated protein Csm3
MEVDNMSEVNLKAKVHITGTIQAITGIAVGGSGGALEIGGVDNPIIRNPLTNEPYIPGSSLKGKLRSLLEKFLGKDLNYKVTKTPLIRIHRCENENDYLDCPVCIIFGSSEKEINKPSRLIVRDSFLIDGDIKKELEEKGDLPYSELKTETIIDRITAQAMPRDLERVPAGAEFNLDLIFDIYNKKDVDFLKHLFKAMRLLEDDYIGGSGTRGSGQIKFTDISVNIKEENYYDNGEYEKSLEKVNGQNKQIEAILQNIHPIQEKLNALVK